jgi:hypothetical protein
MHICTLLVLLTAHYSWLRALAYDVVHSDKECWDGLARNEIGSDHFIAGSLENAGIEVTLSGVVYDPRVVTELIVDELYEIKLKSTNHFFHGFKVQVISFPQGLFQLLIGKAVTTGGATFSSCSSRNSAIISEWDKDVLMDEASVLLLIESGQEDISIEVSVLLHDPYVGGYRGSGTDQAWYSTSFVRNYVLEEQDESERLLQFFNETIAPTGNTFFPFPTPEPTVFPTVSPTVQPTNQPTDPLSLSPTLGPFRSTLAPTRQQLRESPKPTIENSGPSNGAIVGYVIGAFVIVAIVSITLFVWKRRKNTLEPASVASLTPAADTAAKSTVDYHDYDSPPPDVLSHRVDTVIASLINTYTNPNPIAGDYRPTVKDQCRTVMAPDPLAQLPVSPAVAAAAPPAASSEHRQSRQKDPLKGVATGPATAAAAKPKKDRRSLNNNDQDVAVVASQASRSTQPVLVAAVQVVDDEDEQQGDTTNTKRKAIDP